MTVLQFYASYFLLSVLITLTAYGLYSLREEARKSRRKEAEQEAVEEFRRELDEGVPEKWSA